MKGVFVVGTDTGVGKTYVSGALLAAAPTDVGYVKPIQTGSPPDDDLLNVRYLSGAGPDRAPDLGRRLKAPISPHHAAKLERTQLTVTDLIRPLRALDDRPQRWIVEGAGGLLTPLNERETMADLARALDLPVLVVAAVRLGAINATLLTLRALAGERLACLGVVLVGPEDLSLESALDAHAPRSVLGRIELLERPVPAVMRELGRVLLRSPRLSEALG